jgi:hypothetical protein
MGVETAILGAAGIGAGASLLSGKQGADAAKAAGSAQERAALAGVQVQRDTAVQSRIDAYPWALAGAQALYAYMGELGVPMPQTPILPDLNSGPFAANTASTAGKAAKNALDPRATRASDIQNIYGQYLGRRPTEAEAAPWLTAGKLKTLQKTVKKSAEGQAFKSANGVPLGPYQDPNAPGTFQSPANMAMTPKLGFRETPGYQFAVQEGERGVVNNLGALGMRNSGAALKALTRFRQGMADQEYGTYMNRLSGAAGMGQTQTANTNAMMGQAAQGISQGMGDAGAARGSGYVGASNAWSGALGGVANTAGNALGWMSYMNK